MSDFCDHRDTGANSWQHLPFSYLEEDIAFDAFAFRQIIDSLPQCIFWKDASGRFLGCNRAGAQAVGLADAEDIVGKTDYDFHQDSHVADFLCNEDEEVMAAGIPLYRQLSQGSGAPEFARWYETTKVPLRSASGTVVGLLISYEDVTERQRGEAALRQANEHLDVAANYTQNWNWWVDQHGQLRWISPSVETLCGYSVFDCFGMEDYPYPIIHADDHAAMRDFLSHQTSGEWEFRLRHQDSRLLWGRIDRRHVVDRHGRFLGVRYSVHDITARKEAEQELMDLNFCLEKRVAEAIAAGLEQERMMLHQSRHAAMGEMISIIAHQWRQPLTTLGLLLQNIQYDSLGDPGDRAELARRYEQAFQLIERMSATIDDFRDFFRPAEKLAPMNAGDCLAKVLVLMDASLRNAQIQVDARLDAGGDTFGKSNELGQVLLNLLTNAKDALDGQRREGRRIECAVEDADGTVRIRIANNGGTVPPEQMERIFDPYFTTKEDGTGLGLYIARQIVEGHFRGTLACANTADGVEFRIVLPGRRHGA